MDYPALPQASREVPLHGILKRIDLEDKWSLWELWDKFTCFYLAITSAAPFVNRPDSSLSDRVSVQSLLSTLDNLLRRDIAKLKGDEDPFKVPSTSKVSSPTKKKKAS
jgi:hypothetical protein